MKRPAALLTAALAAVVVSALAACGPAKQETRQQPKTVVTTAAVRSTIAIALEYPARIRPRAEIVVSSRIAGRVAAVSADVGQAVRAGQILVTMESRDFEAQSRQAKATLDSAQANLTRTSDSALSAQDIQAQAAVKQAQVQYDDAKDLADRTEKLYNDGTATRQQRDNAKSRLESAAIALDAAQQSLTLLQQKSGPQSTGVATSQVDQAQATLELAQSQLENTVVRSPIAGTVSTRAVDPGELVGAGTPVFVIIDVSSMTAEASVEESTVHTIRKGQVVPVRIDSAGTLDGVVETISPAADPRTQGYTVKLRVVSPPPTIRPGMFARVSFTVEERRAVLVVPNSAVITETGVDYVFAVAGGVVKKRAVQTGISDDTVTEITAGLDDGASVVTEGQSFLTDGEPVTTAP